MEPWEEALDVDDSDLPSLLLRPCKRLRRHQDTISTTAAGFSFSQPDLAPCSTNSSQALAEKEEPRTQQLEGNLPSDSDKNSEQLRRRVIPGPAGAVQSAMLQKTIDRQNRDFSSSQCANPIATQEYIRRAVENAPEFDENFSRNPWISALQYIGMKDGAVSSIPLSSIKDCKAAGKAEQVVAVIKSCTQNSLGGMMVTLKDPTGTIGAFVHHKIFSENKFWKDFSVGSVVILQKVAIFSPSMSVHYLNILLKNVLKVFNKDTGPSSQHNDLAHLIEYAAPARSGIANLPKKAIPEQGSCEVMDEMRKYRNKEASSHYNSQIEEVNSKCSSRSSLKENIALDNDPMILTRDSIEGPCKGDNGDNRGSPGDNDGRQRFSTPQDRLTNDDAAENLMMNRNGEETRAGNIGCTQNQKLLAASLLPQWTDEQLAELFAGDDDENDGSFF